MEEDELKETLKTTADFSSSSSSWNVVELSFLQGPGPTLVRATKEFRKNEVVMPVLGAYVSASDIDDEMNTFGIW